MGTGGKENFDGTTNHPSDAFVWRGRRLLRVFQMREPGRPGDRRDGPARRGDRLLGRRATLTFWNPRELKARVFANTPTAKGPWRGVADRVEGDIS